MKSDKQTALNPYDFSHCPKCGSRLRTSILEDVPRLQCENCLFIFYQNPVPAVAAIVLRHGELLLVRRKYVPRVGYWCLPAGFVEYSETVKEGLIREVKEETNLDIEVGEVFDVYSTNDDSRHNIVLIVYWANVIGGELKPGDDATEVANFPLHGPIPDLAFASHKEAIKRLQQEYLT